VVAAAPPRRAGRNRDTAQHLLDHDLEFVLTVKTNQPAVLEQVREGFHWGLTGRLRDTHGLLVVNEAQHLTTKALEGLRSLRDATGTGLALVGSDKLYDRLTGGSRSSDFPQLFSRIGKRVRLPGATGRRRSELGKIHIGAEQLFDDDSDYRDMLQAVAGARSAADLDEAGRRTVTEHLKACGAEFRPARKSGLRRKPPAPPPETERQARKIRAMLAEDGLPDTYAEAIPQRMCSHPHRVPLQWASSKQLGNVIAALSYRKRRIERRATEEARGT